MAYIPKIAIELQPFSTVEEMNHHMNLHYVTIKTKITKSFDSILHHIKKYACKVAGVCWLKQERLANLANVSVKTVERAMKFFKENGILKIYHTKRSNGLNGNCYYVLQPFHGELVMDDEEIVSVDEGNVGAGNVPQIYEATDLEDYRTKDKLLKSSKALESSLKTKKEEEFIYNARVKVNINQPYPEESSQFFVEYLVNRQFSKETAMEITSRLLHKCKEIDLRKLQKAFVNAHFKFLKRSNYEQPIYSVVDYFVRLVMAELEMVNIVEEVKRSKQKRTTRPANIRPNEVLYDWLKESEKQLGGSMA